MPKKKRPTVFKKEELHAKGTTELLAYLKKLHQCEESFALSDMDENEDLDNSTTIYFKQTDKWKSAYQTVKSILKNREHIEKEP